MATHANSLVNSALQVSAGGAYFSRAYRKYCGLLNAIPNLPADAPDEAVGEAQEAANEVRDNILSARAGTLGNLAIKLRVLAQDEKDALHCTGGDADTFGRFALLAADLDCILSAEPEITADFASKVSALSSRRPCSQISIAM